MARKIRAKTLGRLLTRYLDSFHSEAIEHAADSEDRDGAELLDLLPEDRAWKTLRSLPAGKAKKWLESCQGESLARLIRHARPDAPPAPEEEQVQLAGKVLAILTESTKTR